MRSLSYILRHEPGSLSLKKGGYVPVAELLQLDAFKNMDAASLQLIVSSDAKRRYSLREMDGELHIRANQGHSFPVDLLLEPLTAPLPGGCMHGTYQRHLTSILKDGLRRMSREHIHMAPVTQPQLMRKDCSAIIYVDMEAAMRDGIPFYMSENGVVLTPGIEGGRLPPCYLKGALPPQTPGSGFKGEGGFVP